MKSVVFDITKTTFDLDFDCKAQESPLACGISVVVTMAMLIVTMFYELQIKFATLLHVFAAIAQILQPKSDWLTLPVTSSSYCEHPMGASIAAQRCDPTQTQCLSDAESLRNWVHHSCAKKIETVNKIRFE